MLEDTARRRPRSGWQFHNVRLFLAGRALSNIGTFSQIVALSLLVLQLTDSGLALGAVMAIQGVPLLVFAPWAGSLLDRVSLQRTLVFTSLAGGAQAAALALLALTGTINLPWVMVLAFGLGCVTVFDRPAGQAFVAELVPREALASAVGLSSSAQAMGRLIGPALAAVLYTWGGAGSVFALNAASFGAVLLGVLLLRSSELLPRALQSAHGASMAPALLYGWRSPAIRSTLVANAIIGLLAFNFATFFASLASLTFQQPDLFGIGETINAVFSLLAGVVLARRLHQPSLRLVGITAVGLGASLLWIAVSPTSAVFLAAMPLFGCVTVCYISSAQALVQQRSPAEMGGRMMSLFTLGSMGTTPLGALLVGAVIDRWSPRAAIGMGAASALLTGLALLLIASRTRCELEPALE